MNGPLPENSLPLLPLVLGSVPPGLRMALAQEGVPTVEADRGLPGGKFFLFDSLTAEPGELAQGQVPLDVAPLRAGPGPDPFVALVDRQSTRRWWQLGPWRVSEEVARFDKRQIRRRLMDELRGRLEQLGGIWLRVGPYPFPFRSVFNLRLDHDDFDAADFDRLLTAIDGRERSTSHFICGSTHHDQFEALQRLRGLDVGSHGYWHHTYHDPAENLRNVRRGMEVLQAAGITPSGFVAPGGRFNAGLQGVLDQLAVSHSSEFALAYDDWPFFPTGSQVLQLPVHPICLGLFLEAARGPLVPPGSGPLEAAQAAAQHLAQAVQAKYRAGEPILLYGHPDKRLGRYPQVIEAVYSAVGECGSLWATTLSQWNDWWRLRSAVKLAVWAERDGYRATAEGLPARFPVAVEFWRDQHVAVMPVRAAQWSFAPSALAYLRRPDQPPTLPVRIDGAHRAVAPAQPIRQRLKRWLDWEKATPLDEIPRDTVRGWLKHRLRTWRK